MARARLATTCLVVVLLVALAGSAEYANAAQADGSDPPPAPYRVLLATPCYDGQVTHAFHLSVVRAYEHYQRQTSSGQELSLESAIVPGIADLPKARAALVSQFLKRTELTHLLFVDADMKFAPELILRLARSGRDVVAAMYPKRHVNWENIAKWRHEFGKPTRRRRWTSRNGRRRRRVRRDQPRRRRARLPVRGLSEHETGDKNGGETGELFVDENGFARVKRVPTGFTMVSGDALERMIEHYPELTFLDPDTGDERHALFHPLFASKSEKRSSYLSEDFSFCDRWRSIPGNEGVWVDTVGWVDHVVSPTMTFSGKAWMSRFLSKDEL